MDRAKLLLKAFKCIDQHRSGYIEMPELVWYGQYMQQNWTVFYCKSALHGIFAGEDAIELPDFVEFNMHELRQWRSEAMGLRIRLFVEVGRLSQRRMDAIKKVWATVSHPPSMKELMTISEMVNPKVSTAMVAKLVRDIKATAVSQQAMRLADFIAFFAAVSNPVDDDSNFDGHVQQVLQRSEAVS
jgi:Ca2+-binding EF-hand superfamily protein